MKKLTTLIILLMLQFRIVNAQMPDVYKEVDQILCLVDDIENVIQGWERFGFTSIGPIDEIIFKNNMYRNDTTSFSAKIALAKLGEANITWLQPGNGNSYFTDYLKLHGPSAFSLMHRFSNKDAYEAELERITSKEIEIVQQGTIKLDNIELQYTLFDTYGAGDYVLGLLHAPDIHSNLKAQAPFDGRFSQYAFATNSPEEVSEYWQQIGIPAMNVTHTDVWEKRYYGKAHDFDMKLGWQRHGNIVYEWCIPLQAPTVYTDHIEKRGEGIQHIGLSVPDIDKAIRHLTSRGFAVAQSGGWGEKGQPGSGRFAYMDTDRFGGLMVELLWSHRSDN